MPRKQKSNKSSVNTGSGKGQAKSSSKYQSNDEFPSHLLLSKNNQHHCKTTNIEALVPNAVYIARNALSSRECQEWINYAESSNNFDVVSHPATKWIAHRECSRIQKNDCNMAHRLYQRILHIVNDISPQLDIFDKASLLSNDTKFGRYSAFLSEGNDTTISSNNAKQLQYQPITCNGNLRLYKYDKGQWFGKHVDESNKIDSSNISNPFDFSDDNDVKDAQTEITVLFYLSTCTGGATRFHLPHSGSKKKKKSKDDTSVAFVPEEGAVLLHIHGDRCLEHEAEPVLDGVKYVLRTDVVYGIK